MRHTKTTVDVEVRSFGTRTGGGVATIEPFGDVSNLPFVLPAQSAELWKHCGCRRVLFMWEADESKTLTSINAVIDVYYVSDQATAAGAVKIGRVSYMGKLVPGSSNNSDPSWTVSYASSLNFTRDNAAQMPELVREVGPGVFVTFVIQTIFGTSYGQQLCGLEDYHIPAKK